MSERRDAILVTLNRRLKVILGHPSYPRLDFAPVWSPFPNPLHPARIRICRARAHTYENRLVCHSCVSPSRETREREKSSARSSFYFTRLPPESYAGDDELFLVTGGRAGAATKDRFQQPAMNSLKGEEEP